MEGDSIYNETVTDAANGADTPVGGPVEQMEWNARRLVLAGIGACATVLDTAEQTFDDFVQRGQQVQEDWQERADEMRQRNMGTRMRARDTFRSVMDLFLDTLNVPSKADVDTINVKLNILTRKIDSLQMQEMAREAPPPPEPPADSDLAT